jgi:type IV pilus assembly protein PilV
MRKRNSSRALGSISSSGFSLVETLVALAVLSIGLLGLAMLQVQGMKFTNESYFRTQATVLAYDILDRMRSNKVGADAGSYGKQAAPITGPPTAPSTCGDLGNTCTGSPDLAAYDLTRWYQSQSTLLPGATSSITRVDATSTYTITINWKESNGTDAKQSWELVI